MKKHYTQQGKTIYLGAAIGHGGEGSVFQVAKNNALVVKLYNQISKNPNESNAAHIARVHRVRATQEQKILTMIANPPYDAMREMGHVSMAWPIAAIYEHKQFVGFSMPKVEGFTVYEVLQPNQRLSKHPQLNHQHIYRIARNIATVIAALHRKGYVIGDINFKNIMCQYNTLVTLIDCDSIQVRDGQNRTYLCPVGMPDYTPTELQMQNLQEVERTADHDGFGIAVLMFQLLMQGFHPFQCVSKTPNVEIEQIHVYCIKHGIFPYVDQTKFRPAPIAPAFSILPGTLRHQFGLAFSKPGFRPSAASWVEVISAIEKRLVPCPKNPQHYYPSDGGCVLCAVAQNATRITGKLPVTTSLPPVGKPLSGAPSLRVTPPPPVSVPATTVKPTLTWSQRSWWGKVGLILIVLGAQIVWPSSKWLAVNLWRLLGYLWYGVCRYLLWPGLKWLGRAMWWFVWAPGARYRVVTVVVLAAMGGAYLMPKGYQLWSRIYPNCTATAMIQQQWPMLPAVIVAQMHASNAPKPISIAGLLQANQIDVLRYHTQFDQCVGDQGVVTATVNANQVAIAHEYVLIAYRRTQYPGIQWYRAQTIVSDIAQAYHKTAPNARFVHLQLATIAPAGSSNATYDWLLPTDGHWLMYGDIAKNTRTIHVDRYVEGPFSDMRIVTYATPSQLAVQLQRHDVVLVLPDDAPMMAQYLSVSPLPIEYNVVLIPTGLMYVLPH